MTIMQRVGRGKGEKDFQLFCLVYVFLGFYSNIEYRFIIGVPLLSFYFTDCVL